MSGPKSIMAIKLHGQKAPTFFGGDTSPPFDATEYTRTDLTPDPAAIARAALEEAEKRCDQIIAGFLSPEYSIGQPMASFAERFGAGECKDAIRALMEPAALAEIVKGVTNDH
jgi:hypothetical protein